MAKVQKLCNPQCNTPSSEPSRIDLLDTLMLKQGAVSIFLCRFLNDKECPAYLQYRQLVEKFRMEMKSTSISEDASNNEVKDEPRACVKQEQNEHGPVSFQPESSSVTTASIKREHPDEMTPVKQENARSSIRDQEDDNSHHSEGIYTF